MESLNSKKVHRAKYKPITSKYTPLLLLLFYATVLFLSNTSWTKNQILKWDSMGYYNYLPAIFIYNDLLHFSFYDEIDEKYRPSDSSERFALRTHPKTKKTVIKYTSGVAIMQLPAFLLAHAVSCGISKYPNDGYSQIYQLFVLLNNITFVCWGLFFLYKLLIKEFSKLVSLLSLLIIAAGTNLFFYASLSPGMSHGYLFFLYAAVLHLTSGWYSETSIKNSILLGLSIGMIGLIRPTDILIILIPILWYKKGLCERLFIWKENLPKIIISLLSCFIVLGIQAIYWQYTTDSWIYYSYQNEGFYWFDSKVFQGLFSYRKGWFVYTPLALVAFIFTFAMLFSKFKSYSIMILFFYIPMIYIVFSWSNWYYGGSFGCRALMQSLALLAFPLTFGIEKTINCKSRIVKIIALVIFSLGMILNLFQTWQYNQGIIHWDSMNKEKYWKVFLQYNEIGDTHLHES